MYRTARTVLFFFSSFNRPICFFVLMSETKENIWSCRWEKARAGERRWKGVGVIKDKELKLSWRCRRDTWVSGILCFIGKKHHLVKGQTVAQWCFSVHFRVSFANKKLTLWISVGVISRAHTPDHQRKPPVLTAEQKQAIKNRISLENRKVTWCVILGEVVWGYI